LNVKKFFHEQLAQDVQERIVAFDFDPLSLLRALAEGRLLTIVGASGSFEIAVTPDGVSPDAQADRHGLMTAAKFH